MLYFKFSMIYYNYELLASSVSATEALAKEHRERRNEPLAVVSAVFSMPKNSNGSLALGCRYFYI